MPGTKEGGAKAAQKNKERYGEDFYRRIGTIGGKNGKTGGFASTAVGADGMTGPERASVVGRIGGQAPSPRIRRRKNESEEEYQVRRSIFILNQQEGRL